MEQAWLGERRARLLGDRTGDMLDVGTRMHGDGAAIVLGQRAF
jgi:hypothetical protein